MDWIKRLFRSGGEAIESHETASPVEQAHASPTPSQSHVYTNYAFDEPSIRIAAIGDLHGRIDLLRQVGDRLDGFAADPDRRLIEVYLGDYVDRGGHSQAVLDYLRERSTLKDRDVVCLAGNHEHMLLAAMDSDREFQSWMSYGGQTTLLSYGLSLAQAKTDPTRAREAFRAALPQSHLDFLSSLAVCYRRGSFFFAHAGVRPGIPLEQQTAKDLLWIRRAFLSSSVDFGAVVVHGHTPVTQPEFRRNRICIDTGAYGSGVLTCLTITSDAVSTFDTAREVDGQLVGAV